MESRLEYSKYITSYLGSLEMSHKFQHFNLDPYQWQSYLDITEKEKIVEPGYESRDHIHSKLLFTGSCHVEGLVMQWMACMGNQNWIQRFGNVRMLLWIPQASALKIMAPVSVRERSKCSIVREAFSDARIVALPNSSKLSSFKEEIIQESIIFDEKDFSNPAYPMALVEFNPKDTNIDDMYTWDFVTKNMMILKTRPVSESIKNLGPGAEIYFKEKLNEKLWKQRVNSLTATDFHTITKVFDLWPFKPDTMIDFLSDERS
jgi:transcription factor 1